MVALREDSKHTETIVVLIDNFFMKANTGGQVVRQHKRYIKLFYLPADLYGAISQQIYTELSPSRFIRSYLSAELYGAISQQIHTELSRVLVTHRL